MVTTATGGGPAAADAIEAAPSGPESRRAEVDRHRQAGVGLGVDDRSSAQR